MSSSNVIRLSKAELEWIERYRICHIAEAQYKMNYDIESGEYDLYKYSEMSIRDLIHEMIARSKFNIETYLNDRNINIEV